MGLKDRLKAMGVSTPVKAAPPSGGCRIMRAEFDDYARISSDAIELMDGATWPDFDLTRALFIDTETTGLSGGAGTVAFLVGMGWLTEGRFCVEQLFMPDYDAEEDLLVRVLDRLKEFDAVITFNGKSFDIPLLESRMIMHRMRLPEKKHLDLLHPARRTWKLRLSKCNLGALEAAILGTQRANDIPGAEIPTRYFEYLKTREENLLTDVFEHNARDVRSMLHILSKLAGAYDLPLEQKHIEDVFSVGRVLIKRGYIVAGHRCFRMADGTRLSEIASVALSMSLKKQMQIDEAVEIWLSMIERGEHTSAPVELAKYYEHVVKDCDAALKYAFLAQDARRIARLIQKKEKALCR